jgi:hypothetical protein
LTDSADPAELATTQLLPYLLTLSGFYRARDRVRRLLEGEGQGESPCPARRVPGYE